MINLKMCVNLLIGGPGLARGFSDLIDTGAEIYLIRKGLVPPIRFLKAQRPVELMAPNRKRLEGGGK